MPDETKTATGGNLIGNELVGIATAMSAAVTRCKVLSEANIQLPATEQALARAAFASIEANASDLRGLLGLPSENIISQAPEAAVPPVLVNQNTETKQPETKTLKDNTIKFELDGNKLEIDCEREVILLNGGIISRRNFTATKFFEALAQDPYNSPKHPLDMPGIKASSLPGLVQFFKNHEDVNQYITRQTAKAGSKKVLYNLSSDVKVLRFKVKDTFFVQ
jgi:hypothetical protein